MPPLKEPGAWYYDAVDYATDEGLFNGTGPSTFDPEGSMTRGMFVTVLANKTEGFMASQYRTVSFVDVPGHYETVTRLEIQEVTVGEIGHWIDGYTTEWVYRCNKCGFISETVDGINEHLDSTIDWETRTGHDIYTMVSGDPIYTGEKYWVVDVPRHKELKMVEVTDQVWIEETGHWE